MMDPNYDDRLDVDSDEFDDNPLDQNLGNSQQNYDILNQDLQSTSRSVKTFNFNSIYATHFNGNSYKIVVLERSESLFFRGAIDAKCFYGAAECMGFHLTSSFQPIISPQHFGLLSIDALVNSTTKPTGLDIKFSEEDIQLGLPQVWEETKNKYHDGKSNSLPVSIVIIRSCNQMGSLAGNENAIFSNALTPSKPKSLNKKSNKSVSSTSANEKRQLETALVLKEMTSADKIVYVPDHWKQARMYWSSTKQADQSRILVCGRQNTGKSTMMRYIMNTLLNEFERVALLDLDLGQPELTPPGLLSLTIIGSPLLGPPFSNMRLCKPHHQTMQFIGSTSPKEKVNEYLHAIGHLLQHFHSLSPSLALTSLLNSPNSLHNSIRIPLVINTHGWVQNQGLSILHQILRMATPTLTIQMGSDNIFGDDMNGSQIGAFKIVESAVIHQSYSSIRSTERRHQQIISYFGSSRTTYKVPWKALNVHLLDADIDFSQIMFVLNASIVALFVDKTKYTSYQQQYRSQPMNIDGEEFINSSNDHDPSNLVPDADPDLPKFLLDAPTTQSSYCVGLGLITFVDCKSKLFYISTDISPSKLQLVNTIVKGNIEIPSEMFVANAIPQNPYLTADNLPSAESGSGNLVVRNNVLRKPYQAPK